MEELLKQLISAVKELGAHSILDWAPIFLSVVAVFVAVYVPVKIAKKQNQIEIFDKLYTAYSQLILVKSFAATVKNLNFQGDLQADFKECTLFCVHFETSFHYHPDLIHSQDSIGKATAVLRTNEIQANMIPLLIAKNAKEQNQCYKKIIAIYEPLFSLVTAVILYNPDQVEETNSNLQEFVKATDAFFNEYSEKIESALRCK